MERRHPLTVEGKPRVRRQPMDVDDVTALMPQALRHITEAGKAGITRAELEEALDIGRRISKEILSNLKAAKRVRVGLWRNRARAYVAGSGPDALPAHARPPKRKNICVPAEKLAGEEIRANHERWCESWRPTCDFAADWLFHAPVHSEPESNERRAA